MGEEIERKLVMLGDSGVGKSALVQRFVKDKFSEEYRPTSGANPYKKSLAVGEKEIELVIWDIAGHTIKLHPAFTSEAHGAILVCDLSKPITSESLIQWHDVITRKVGKVPVVVAANKWDIAETQECDVLRASGYNVIRTSAKTGKNVDKVFREIISKIV